MTTYHNARQWAFSSLARHDWRMSSINWADNFSWTLSLVTVEAVSDWRQLNMPATWPE